MKEKIEREYQSKDGRYTLFVEATSIARLDRWERLPADKKEKSPLVEFSLFEGEDRAHIIIPEDFERFGFKSKPTIKQKYARLHKTARTLHRLCCELFYIAEELYYTEDDKTPIEMKRCGAKYRKLKPTLKELNITL